MEKVKGVELEWGKRNTLVKKWWESPICFKHGTNRICQWSAGVRKGLVLQAIRSFLCHAAQGKLLLSSTSVQRISLWCPEPGFCVLLVCHCPRPLQPWLVSPVQCSSISLLCLQFPCWLSWPGGCSLTCPVYYWKQHSNSVIQPVFRHNHWLFTTLSSPAIMAIRVVSHLKCRAWGPLTGDSCILKSQVKIVLNL